MAEEWADSGYLFKAVEESELGVTQARFRMSGYLTDSGGMPAAEYQRQLAAAENHVEYRRTGAGVAPAVRSPMQPTQLEVTSLTSSMAGARVREDTGAGVGIGSRGPGLLDGEGGHVPFLSRVHGRGSSGGHGAAAGG